MRVSNLLKHLSLFHVWWRSSVETWGTTSRRERGSAAETAASRSRKRTQTCCYWQVLPFNHKSDFSLATVPQSIPTFGSLVGEGSHWSAEDFLHDGCGKVKTGRVLEKGAQSGPSTASSSSSSSSSTAVRLRLQSRVQCPPTKTNPEQCCLPFQWPHEDSRQLFRVIFMSKVRLIQL